MESLSKELENKMKGREVWITNYNGHEIKVINKNNIKMYIDDVEVAKNKSLIFTQTFLYSVIPDTDKTVIARVYQRTSSDQFLSCDFIIGDTVPVQYGYQHKDGTVDLLSNEEIEEYHRFLKDDYNTAIHLLMH